MKNNIITVLDIGSWEIKAISAELSADLKINKVVKAQTLSEGIEEGQIVDLNCFINCIEKVVNSLEQQLGNKICKVNICIGGDQIKPYYSEGLVTVSEVGSEIRSQDVERAVESAKLLSVPMDRKILHIYNLGFEVDGISNIVNPVGMFGANIKSKIYIITILEKKIQNIFKSVNNIGIQVENVMFSGFMNIFSLFKKGDEYHQGLIVDIGSDFTYTVIFKEKSFLKIGIYNWGGKNISKAIKRKLNIPFKDAETKKKEITSIYPRRDLENLVQDSDEVNLLLDTIYSEVYSFFHDRLKSDMNRQEFDLASENFIITGGTTFIGGLAELVEDIFSIKTKVSSPKLLNLEKESTLFNNPSQYSSVIGTLNYCLEDKFKKHKKASNKLQVVFSGIKDFFTEYF